MKRRLMSLAWATALALATAGTAAAQEGNVATNSVGTVQVSDVASAPAAAADGPVAGAAVSAPVQVAGSGGNSATDSIGTAQVGGGNSAGDSAGSAQVSATDAAPTASTEAAGASASLAAPVAAGTDGDNTAENEVLTVQAGTPTASPQVAADVGGDPVVVEGSVVTVDGEDALSADPGALQLEAERIGVTPDFLLAVDPIARLETGGSISTAPNDGNTSGGSLLTGQAGSVTAAPTVAVGSEALATSGGLDGSSGVEGAGTNAATDSLGTAQAGGGNTAEDSAGTLQVAGVQAAPALAADSPLGSARLDGSSGIADGSNSAVGSLGTAQVGGGNAADGSTGTVQAGAVTVGPALAVSDTPAGDASVGGSSGVSGSGNDATGSVGTAQVGGGNNADRSQGTTQAGPVSVGQTVDYEDTPAGGGEVGSPMQIGSGSGNSARTSTGTVQVGGGNTTRSSTGTVQTGGTRTLAGWSGTPSVPAVPIASVGLPAAPEADMTVVAGQRFSAPSATPGEATPAATRDPRLAETQVLETLPFTGLSLTLLVALGFGLALAGLGVRARAALQ
jgi:hypothetical protein